MATNAFLGLRGTGDFTVTGQRPKSWREGILFFGPNGKAPLTAITSMGKSKKVDDPEFNWYRKQLPKQVASFTATEIYTDANLGSGIGNGASTAAGTALFVKMAQDAALEFRAGHQVTFRDQSHANMTVTARVVDRLLNGANSYVAVITLEVDDNGSASDLYEADELHIIGTLNAEHAEMPEAMSYDPTRLYNFTQIFRNPLAISRTAMNTRLRTGDSYKEQKREALELHAIEMEKAWFWSTKFEGLGSNGKPLRTTGGLNEFIRANAPENCDDFRLNATYSGDSWTDSGKEWMNSYLELIFRLGSDERLALCGSTFLQGINDLAETWADIKLEVQAPAYGIKVHTWHTPHGTVHFKTHPLFTQNFTTRNQAFIIDPKEISFRYVTDTMFKSDKNGENSGSKDGREEEYLTEAGLEFGIPEVCGILSGGGLPNAV